MSESVPKPLENEKLGYLGYLGFLAFLALPIRNFYLLALFGFFLFFLAFKKISRLTKYAVFCAISSIISSIAHNFSDALVGETFIPALFFILTFLFFFAIPILLIWRVSLCFKHPT